MMVAPDKPISVLRHLEQRQAHQRRAGEIETLLVPLREIRRQASLLFGWSEGPPVGAVPRELDVRAHQLERLLQALPHERRTQDSVAGDDLLPGAPECVIV